MYITLCKNHENRTILLMKRDHYSSTAVISASCLNVTAAYALVLQAQEQCLFHVLWYILDKDCTTLPLGVLVVLQLLSSRRQHELSAGNGDLSLSQQTFSNCTTT